MRQFWFFTLSVFMLCSMLLLATLRNTEAGNPAYSIIEYPSINTAVVDGQWTTPDEWTDTPATPLRGNATGMFGYNIQDFFNLGLEWVIEIFTDNTNDTGDYWQICLDNNNTGGTAPDIWDFKIEIIGHTQLKVYRGTGTGWTEVTPLPNEIRWSNRIAASPWNSTPHWILEIVDISKVNGTVQVPNPPPTGMRIAAYDARTRTLAAWPPNSRADVPDEWGVIPTFSLEPIPENLNLPAIALLFALTIIVISRRKPKQTTKK
ncbi:MAG: hypothetical protein NZ932_01805 [Candidatus Bathyarchaeota archaeon]|nr:hypothetical protein [Candidatus Bathyarchaeota archaeon]MDW8040013.1 hypothetical protein [Nitrososphaerota archaeon]